MHRRSRTGSSSCRSCSSSGSAWRTSARRSRLGSRTTRPAIRCASPRSATPRCGCSDRSAVVELVPLERAEECCGFGGTFAIKNAATSAAIVADKCSAIEASGAEYCTAVDGSCLLQIGGALSRVGAPARVIHLAEILASTGAGMSVRPFPEQAKHELAQRPAALEPARRPPTRSGESGRVSSPSCPIGTTCARQAARSRLTCWRGSTSTSWSSSKRSPPPAGTSLGS